MPGNKAQCSYTTKSNIIFTNQEIRGREEMAERNSTGRMVAGSLDDPYPTNTADHDKIQIRYQWIFPTLPTKPFVGINRYQ
jgi:hypothetical protein